jgi:hypothetical protein
LDSHERFHFHFALGKALEDEADFEKSKTALGAVLEAYLGVPRPRGSRDSTGCLSQIGGGGT